MLNLTEETEKGAVAMVWWFLTAQLDLGCINLRLTDRITTIHPLIKGSNFLPPNPMLAIGKRILSPCVPQSTCIVHVIKSKRLF